MVLVTVVTFVPGHFFLLLSGSRPIITTRYKRNRGILRPCGISIRLAPTTCLEQLEPGNTLFHTFLLPAATLGSIVHYLLTTDCNPANRPSTTVPIAYTYRACVAGDGTAIVRRSTNTFASADSNPCSALVGYSWQVEEVDTDNMWSPAATTWITIPQAGTYRIRFWGKLTRIGPGSAAHHANINLFGGPVIACVPIATLGPNQTTTFAAQVTRNLTAGQRVRAVVTVPGGTTTFVGGGQGSNGLSVQLHS